MATQSWKQKSLVRPRAAKAAQEDWLTQHTRYSLSHT